MASTSTSSRRALSLKSLQGTANAPNKSGQRVPSASFKRPRSPEAPENSSTAKKARASLALSASALQKEKDAKRERQEREQQKQEFKDKYTKAFPSWTFYFDTENISMKTSQINLLRSRVQELGGVRNNSLLRELPGLTLPLASRGVLLKADYTSRN
jgi:regulatory subunit for Cdc7p protein kinase